MIPNLWYFSGCWQGICSYYITPTHN